MGRSIALANNCKDGYGDGPIRIGLGGLVVAVEAARNDNLIFIKNFGIIYIQAKKISDIFSSIKGTHSK